MHTLKSTCKSENIEFDKYDQHVHCIAHVLNLAVQKALAMLKAGEATDEDELLQKEQDTQRICNIIPKVN